jgi:hypothetical protein
VSDNLKQAFDAYNRIKEQQEDPDRAELESILKDAHYEINCWNGPDLREALLRWKRGEKVWCEHVKRSGLGGYDFWDGQKSVDMTGLRFCPECGTERPK